LKEIFTGRTPIELVRAYGLTVDEQENLLIADPGSGLVHIIHLPDGNYRKLPHPKDAIEFLSPIDVETDGDGRIYISDSAAKVVHVFDQEGRFERSFGEFTRPTGLALNRPLSRLYVVDTAAHQLRVYATSGKHLFDVGSRGDAPGQFNFPTNISLDRQGNVFVTDSMNFRIQAFDPEGQLLYNFGRAGDGPGFFSKPRGVGVDSDGHIYVVDATFDNVQIFDPSGQILLYFGAPGTEAGKFYLPAGLGIDGRDRIFVADSYNQRIQIFQYLKAEAEAPVPEPLKIPASLIALGQEDDSAFIIEKSTRTLHHFKKVGQETRLIRSYPYTVGKKATETFPPGPGRIPDGPFFCIGKKDSDGTGKKQIRLKSFALNPKEAGGETQILLTEGTQFLPDDGTVKLALNAQEALRETWKEIRISETPFLVIDRVTYTTQEAVEAERNEIFEAINRWKRCWDLLEIDCYIGGYSSDFRHGNMNIKGWKDFKRSIFSRKRESLVTLKTIHALKSGSSVLLTFLQDYRSPNYKDLGWKQLVLRKEGGVWKIIREEWSPYEEK
jgi:sugar lactone lactonase YvrE